MSTTIPNLTINGRNGPINAQLTATQWDLFTMTFDCTSVADALNQALTNAVNSQKTRAEVETIMEKTCKELNRYGAADNEPRAILNEILDEIYGSQPVSSNA